MRITETALARQHMTPESSRLFRDSTLDARLGRSTVAGALNDQVRFRFDKTGRPSEWGLVPDNQLSANLLASPAGPKLEQKLRDVLATVDRGHARGALELQGIMLADDVEGWAAGYQLMQRDAARVNDAPIGRPMTPQQSLQAAKATANIAGAQSLFGWVQLAPDHARSILTSVGAYTPGPDEWFARSGTAAEFMGPLLGHELEHRVSEADFRSTRATMSYMPVAWLEEGAATLLEMRDPRQARANAQAWGVSATSHAGHVGAPDSFDTGWRPWQRDESAWMSFADTAQKNYVDSVETIRGLLRRAGVDRRTNVGRERTESLLQDVEVRAVPERIARAILAERGVRATAERVGTLTDYVTFANEAGGLERIDSFLERVAR